MKLSGSKPFERNLPAAILAASLFALYMYTLAPDLTWANGGSDGGDLISAAAVGGVPHPSGYPLYLLLARLFQALPVGTLAFRTNLMSAFATALAAVLVYALVLRVQAPHPGNQLWPAGLLAGYAFGLAPLVWSQAVITEVYGLQACLLALILFLYSESGDRPALKRWQIFRGLVLGLALGNHLTSILLVPAALLLGSARRKSETAGSGLAQPRFPKTTIQVAAFGRQLLGLGLGLSLYLLLPLHALAQPPINWGNPVSLDRFWWLVSGQLYQGYYLPGNLAGLGARLQAWAAFLLEQCGLPGLLLGLIGLLWFGRAARFNVLSVWTTGIFSAFALLYTSVDSYVYLIPVLLCISVWIGMGISGLALAVSGRFPRAGWLLGLLVLVYCLARGVTHFDQVDASRDLRAVNFGRAVLSSAPEKALVFATGDRAVFTLWYFHYALGERPDLAVLAVDLLHYDWYQQTLRTNYPGLRLPEALPYPETLALANPARASCTIQYTDRAVIACFEPISSP